MKKMVLINKADLRATPPKDKPKIEDLPIRVREAVADDAPFIFNSWLKSYKHSYFGKSMQNEVFFSEQHKVIEYLLKKCKVYVASSEKDPTDIYGYICAEQVDGVFVLHYVYVKHTYRMLGIGTLLLNQYKHDFNSAGICTHMTFTGERLAAKFSMVHNPYVALTHEYQQVEQGDTRYEAAE